MNVLAILFESPVFIITLLVKLGFAAVCNHRESRTLLVIGITCIFSYIVYKVIEVITETIIDKKINKESFLSKNYFLNRLINIIPIIIGTFLFEGFIYSIFATAIQHPFYFALAMNAILWFFIEALILVLNKVMR